MDSIKEDDLLEMAKVFNKYPLHEVIIHPRTASQKYNGSVNHKRFEQACEALNHDIVYSGDICSYEDYLNCKNLHPYINKWMIGRGILKDPLLMQKIRGKEDLDPNSIYKFYSELCELYEKRDFSTHIILKELKSFQLIWQMV